MDIFTTDTDTAIFRFKKSKIRHKFGGKNDF